GKKDAARPDARRHDARRRSFFASLACRLRRRFTVAVAVAEAAPTAAITIAVAVPVALLAAATVLHHRGRAFLECFHPHGDIAQHILVDAHVALELVHRRRRRVEVEEDVVTLAVLLDAIGEVAQAPIFALGDLAALRSDDTREGIGQRLDLRGRDILARNEDVLIKRHEDDAPYGSSRPGAGREFRRSAARA